MSYTHHTNQALNNERNEVITEIHTLTQEFDNATKEERLAVNRDLGIMYRRQFEIEREIQERGRQTIKDDMYTILRQAADLMQNGQVQVMNAYDMEKKDQYEVTIRLQDLSKKDSLAIMYELIHHYELQNVCFEDCPITKVTAFGVNVKYNWAEVFGYEAN